MVTIPRDRIESVFERHGETCFADLTGGDVRSDWVRALADSYRNASGGSPVANDLDALVDRIEREAS